VSHHGEHPLMKTNIPQDSSFVSKYSNPQSLTKRIADDDEFFCQVLDETYLNNPYGLLAELQENKPVYKSSLGPWVITGYQQVAEALKNRFLKGSPQGTELYAHYTNAQSQDNFGSQALSHMQFVDGPEHLRVRRNFASYVNSASTKKKMQDIIRQIVEQLLDELGAAGSSPIDFIGEFASEVPSRFLCKLLGLPISDSKMLARLSNALVAADDPDFLLTPGRQQLTQKASWELSRYLSKAIIWGKKNPGDNLITHLTGQLDKECFTDLQEYIINLIFFIVAGIKTTSDFLGNTLAALVSFPQQAALIRSKQISSADYIEECFRFDTPIQQTPRFVSTPIVIGSYEIPVGAHLMLMVGAANRDQTVFSSPHELNVQRENSHQHIAFGGGAHHCLGTPMAKAEAEIAIPALLDRFPNITLMEGATRAVGFTLRGYSFLPIILGHPARH